MNICFEPGDIACITAFVNMYAASFDWKGAIVSLDEIRKIRDNQIAFVVSTAVLVASSEIYVLVITAAGTFGWIWKEKLIEVK